MIRPAEEKDFNAIMQLWQETNSITHNFISPEYWQRQTDVVRYHYLPTAKTFVFVDKHQIKGFISLLDNNYIGACFVKQIFQRHKIGQKLLRYIQRRKSSLQLHVYAQNNKAISFYHTQGFKIIKENLQPETAKTQLLMCWSLGCPSQRFSRQKGDS